MSDEKQEMEVVADANNSGSQQTTATEEKVTLTKAELERLIRSEADRTTSKALKTVSEAKMTVEEQLAAMKRDFESERLKNATKDYLLEKGRPEFSSIFDYDTSTLEGRVKVDEIIAQIVNSKVEAALKMKVKDGEVNLPKNTEKAKQLSLYDKIKQTSTDNNDKNKFKSAYYQL
jgi:hypothetical protein